MLCIYMQEVDKIFEIAGTGAITQECERAYDEIELKCKLSLCIRVYKV